MRSPYSSLDFATNKPGNKYRQCPNCGEPAVRSNRTLLDTTETSAGTHSEIWKKYECNSCGGEYRSV